jgi:hypothetical protein
MALCSITIGDPAGENGDLIGNLVAPVTGTLVLDIACPRPLRLSVGDRIVLDEDLWWRRYERQVRAMVIIPITAGTHRLTAVYGPRPQWPASVDRDCPSRNREAVRSGLRERLPDRLVVSGEVQPGAAPVAASMRVLAGQCVRSGVTYQHVLVRLLDSPRMGVPGIGCDRPGSKALRSIVVRSPVAPHASHDISDADDRAAGCLRLLVPVANQEEPLPMARDGSAPESRMEPECVVVRTIDLDIDLALARIPDQAAPAPATVPAAVRSCMPVHEARGRLAPVREHRHLSWPDEAGILAAAPRLLLPSGHDSIQRAHDHAWRMLGRLRRQADPHSGLPNDYVGTSMHGFMNEMFVWDSSFTAMCTAWAWRGFPHTATLDCLYSRQMDGGYIHRETDIHEGLAIGYEPDFSPNPPISVVAEWKIAALTGDTARLARVHPVLAAQHRWLRRNRRLPDGTYWTTGLANGLDNSPSLGDGYPDLTAQQVHAAELLGRIAGILGRPDEAAAWERERQETAAAMNARLWSDSQGFYCTSLAEGGHNPNKIATGFWPLWTGQVPAERCDDLARHLLDPASFWRHHPIPSLAADSPKYRSAGGYWLGSSWAPTTAATVWGFARAGRHDLARRLARRHLDVLAEVRDTTGALWENYAPDASARGSQSGPDYSWTALGPIALLYEALIGVRPDALHRRIHWHLPEPGWGLERIPLGDATIDLRVLWNGRVEVATDRPFTLVVEDGRTAQSRRIPAGRWEL